MDHEDWRGWRFAGRCLITPHRDRVSADVLAHLIHMHSIRCHYEREGLAAQARAVRARSAEKRQQLVRVVVVQLDDWKRSRGLGVA